MDIARVVQSLIKKREGQWGVIAAVLVIVVGVGIAIRPDTIAPQFAGTPGCAGAQVDIYAGTYQNGEATLDLRNSGKRNLQLTVYSIAPDKTVTILPTTVYLSSGGQGTFTFSIPEKPQSIEVHDSDCQEAINLWKF